MPKNKESVVKKYNLNPSNKYISILPGSRASEIKNLLPTYIEFIKLHSEKYRDYEYLIPASDQESFNMIEENISKDIITDQILGEIPKRSRGLKEIKKKDNNNTKNLNVQSDRAAALIEQSRKRAMQPVAKESVAAKKTIKPAPTRRRRNTKTSYQPAARAKRLNRSRHMEYKYEMRKLLVDIAVSYTHLTLPTTPYV